MRTVVTGPMPDELTEPIERRRRLGLDLLDEIWDGEYHMNPAPSGPHARLDRIVAIVLERLGEPLGLLGSGIFNLGEPTNYRVPDQGLHRGPLVETWFATAALVVEILSPDDEALEKFDHYAAHGVDEVLLVDGAARRLHWFVLDRASGRYEPTTRSGLLQVDVADVEAMIDWPEVPPT